MHVHDLSDWLGLDCSGVDDGTAWLIVSEGSRWYDSLDVYEVITVFDEFYVLFGAAL